MSSLCRHMEDRRQFAVKFNKCHNKSLGNALIYRGLLVMRYKLVEVTGSRMRVGKVAHSRI